MAPGASRTADLSVAALALAARLTTPYRAQLWLRRFPYNWEADHGEEPSRSLAGVFGQGRANCFEGAVVAAYLLERQGRAPVLVFFDSSDGVGHVVAAFREDGRWGALGKSRYPALMGRRPAFRSLLALAWSYVDPFVDATGRTLSWAAFDLRDLGGADWRRDRHGIGRLDRALDAAPARALEASERRHRAWYRRYAAWKARHPRREPPPSFYPAGHLMW